MAHTAQLLCSFTSPATLDQTLRSIVKTYTIAFDTLYILENVDDPTSLCVTYNIDTTVAIRGPIPEATISLHRKKATNTLYTINALNLLIAELNNGFVDKSYMIKWDDYQNTILVTAYNKLKKIHTKLNRTIKVTDIP